MIEGAESPEAELARMRSELELAQRRLQFMLDAAGATCGWEWDIARKQLFADARFAVITQQDPVALMDGVSTDHFFTSIHPDDLKRVKVAVAGILAGSEVFSKEYRLLRSDGGYRWVHASGRAVLDENDKPVKFVGMLVDITEQKRANEQLRIAQLAGGIGTFEHIVGYGTINVSEQFCRLFGLHPTRILPVRTLNDLIHPDDDRVIDLSDPDGIQNERSTEFRVRRPDDGQERWLARRGEYVDDTESSGRRFMGVIFDITEAKQTHESLREANQALSEIARESMRERNRVWKNSRDLLVVIGTDGVFRDVSPAWLDILGHHLEEVIGRHVIEFVWAEDREQVKPDLRKAVENTHTDLEIRMIRKDGSPRIVSWMTSREGGRVYAYGRDVTLEKQQQAVLEETEAQLRQAQKMEAVGQLTGGIAHDFNNMLTGVIGALAVIKRRIAANRLDDLDKFIDAASASAGRAAALTHRLLAFSRRQSLDRQPVDVRQLIGSMEDLFRRTLGEQVELLIDLVPDTWRAVTDANQLESAILNLVINARDAMPDGGKLTIETANVVFTETDLARGETLKPGSYVVLAVSDTGIGMSQATIEKAFDPFFTTKPIGQGTGLGLSMIYGFTQQSGGHVRIYSQVGLGTTIKLYLPGSLAEISPQNGAIEIDFVPPRGEGETVLVVEDDDSVRVLVVDVLKELGYRVIEAVDGTEALPIIEGTSRIDLLISDVGLPGLNGRQLAEIAMNVRPALKVLFITGYAAMAASRADFLAPGMEMISKPFAIDDLAQKVREIVAGSS
ncbi:PAS/PAC sensor hybrid histidine kinase [Rhizobium sp. CF080]|uniref:PAS domain-containing hybrid sensor histidine kinase/response regulator n=1 Tax=Rhizobium sp. (strain CF080) TaxID=1144310 RepID=UPI0002715E72|nr:PAS domain-containing hybrid sensor histidine kinase/response regulator [Rhizobium sp. CF080]EUB98309.1 PAS/PAC sensor hybrid histidine kinase [Rhizobium sp. CF080]